MKPEVRVFDKQNPCTKIEIYNCFRGPRGYRSVQVDVAHSLIGTNVPRVMERDGKIIKDRQPRGDYYELTEYGEEWLDKGIRSFLRNHPSRLDEVQYPPTDETSPRRRRVRA